jgi:hypothetical protein
MRDETNWALRLGAKPPLGWTAQHELILELADRLWDDLRWIWIVCERYQEYREDATGDRELLAARAAVREAEASVDAAFESRRRWRQMSRAAGSTPEIEDAIGGALATAREARRTLGDARRRVRSAIRSDLERIWRARDRAMSEVASGRSRRYQELHFGVYNDVLARFRIAAREAARRGRVVRPAREHPSASLYLQVPRGRAWDELFGSRSDVLSLAPYSPGPRVTRRWSLLRMRCASDGLAIEIPIRVHREPPAGARVQGVRVVRRRVAGRWEWYVVFSLRSPVATPIERGAGTLWCGTNWRRLADGSLRILDGIDEAGTRVSVCIPPEHVAVAAYSDLLRSALDLRAAEAVRSLPRAEDREAADVALSRRDWSALHTLLGACAWRDGSVQAPERHAALLAARSETGGDAEKYAARAAVILGDRAGRRWVDGARARAIRRRTDLYRRAARWIAERYGRIVLAESDGSRLARIEQPDGTRTPLHVSARHQRQIAAPYALEADLRWAVRRAGGELVEQPAIDLSHTCPICRCEMERREGDRASLHLRCAEHGVWDRDHALAIALWRDDDGAPDREQWVWHAEREQRSRAEIVRVDVEVESQLRGVRPPHSRIRYVSGVALAPESV